MQSLIDLLKTLELFLQTLQGIVSFKSKKRGIWRDIKNQAKAVIPLVESYMLYLKEQIGEFEKTIDQINPRIIEQCMIKVRQLQKLPDTLERSGKLLDLIEQYLVKHTTEIKASRKAGETKLEFCNHIIHICANLEEDAEDFLDDLDDTNEDSKKAYKQQAAYRKLLKHNIRACFSFAKALKRYQGKAEGDLIICLMEYKAMALELKNFVQAFSKANTFEEIQQLCTFFMDQYEEDFKAKSEKWYNLPQSDAKNLLLKGRGFFMEIFDNDLKAIIKWKW